MTNLEQRKWDRFEMAVLRGKTMGILGMGDIGKACAQLAKAFGMRVLALRRNAGKASDPNVDEVIGPSGGPIELHHKERFLEQSDVVVCSLPGTRETKHFMSTAEFEAMKPGSIFVSLGRGVAVDEAALVLALRGDRLLGAALDVFEVEPLPQTSPLWDCAGDKLLLTGHNADLTPDYFELGWDVWSQNLERFKRDEPLVTPVDIGAGY